ncbi:hybrid-cluster NAD(P)-dependent oxidoreductase [Shewanella sp. Choline-02u-19]|uniref:hybrid-cluster NAD(P)-dependent oxidoreductase n=1 Tax=unclassified Shewanella TaxID=196818 RepID=UPI000C33C669|nr:MULTISPECIES: hybrid-cluster NAD(P)-dependent oxidoreductase [unclassified Shewanella]PKG57210.1 hybrid-cluster NAD(P)-dependent oxidoreductase [Shewanella sp. GutDb-MelDb]PKG76448.1 hybrid-cluster NAD(P)-dependent oxidoreductase [Shewanella sp. GutCb]PKH57570.1 hybrid-cluster NAD(P)-dependent oxidoreductase [Shewanella sp. Bg11-22]PKI28431.1 hybrid-cluster NAD(P)-dependent oxidoreductase [Shewanella sp. Choline-02u-19]
MANNINVPATEQFEAKQWQAGEHQLVCVEKWNETHDVVSFRFQGIKPVKFHFKPGQFLTLLLEIDGEKIGRSYTISSSPSRPFSVVLTIKQIDGGKVSNYLANNLDIGHVVRALGPDGAFNLIDIEAENYLFLSAGCGITPMYSMSRWLADTQISPDVCFLHSAKSTQDLIFKDSLEQIAERSRQFKLNYILENVDAEPCAHVDALAGRLSADNLQRLVPDFQSRTVFVCGPEQYMAAVKALLESLNFNMAQFHQESFGSFKGDLGELAAAKESTSSDDASGFMLRVGDRTRSLTSGQTILDGVEAEGLPIIAACRSGVCGACKCKVVEGETESSSQMSLTSDEIAQGYVLACSTKLKSNVTLEL